MSIKKYLEYSKYLDIVEGYENLGYKGRKEKLVFQALVFIPQDLYSNGNYPLHIFYLLHQLEVLN